MGMDVSSTHMVFFIATVIVSAGMIGVFIKSITSISDGIESRSDRLYDDFQTEIKIINDPSNIPNNPVKIYVKNIGAITLDQDLITILIDGEPKDNTTITLTNGEDLWETTYVIKITVNNTNLAAGDHSVKVITDNGASDRMDFRI